MMKNILHFFLPAEVDNTIRGIKLPVYVFALVAVVGTVRSLIHIFSPDGGAGSIAGMDLSMTGADGVIFAFALWGASQLIYAMIQWLVLLRYRSLVPIMWFVQLLEILTRMLAGRLKPVTFAHTPPGAIGNIVILVLSTLMLALYVGIAYRESRGTGGAAKRDPL